MTDGLDDSEHPPQNRELRAAIGQGDVGEQLRQQALQPLASRLIQPAYERGFPEFHQQACRFVRLEEAHPGERFGNHGRIGRGLPESPEVDPRSGARRPLSAEDDQTEVLAHT